jgi:hypothetical protein
MQPSQTFGRKAARFSVMPAALPAVRKMRLKPKDGEPSSLAGGDSDAVRAPAPPSLTVEQELEQWNAARKVRKRSFREPWRTVSIVAGLGFFATSWMLPDTVSDVAQIALGVLTVGSLLAGWRARKTG